MRTFFSAVAVSYMLAVSSHAEGMKEADRQRLLANMTQEDPRSRMLLEGNMDVYQWLVMISTHSQRHILQIREIKAHPSYPRARR